jgi:hypothetical protein
LGAAARSPHGNRERDRGITGLAAVSDQSETAAASTAGGVERATVHTLGEWPISHGRATVRHVDLRPSRATRSSTLQHRLALLVLERQDLRDRRAPAGVLEQNRLDIVHAQQELARALVSEHAAASAA